MILLTWLFQLDTRRHIIPKIDDLVMTWSLQLVMHTCCFAIDHTMHPEPTSPPLWLGRLALITNYDWAPRIQLLVLKIILNPRPFKWFMKCCRKGGTFSSFTICKISHLDKYIYTHLLKIRFWVYLDKCKAYGWIFDIMKLYTCTSIIGPYDRIGIH